MILDLYEYETGLFKNVCKFLTPRELYIMFLTSKEFAQIMSTNITFFDPEKSYIFFNLGHKISRMLKFYSDGDLIEYCSCCRKQWWGGFKFFNPNLPNMLKNN